MDFFLGLGTPKRERISSVDTAWLRMDRPSNLMMICGVLIFEDRLQFDRLRAIIEERFLRFRRFRQKAVQEATGAWWEDDASFDLSAHVHHIALPEPGDQEALQELTSDLLGTPLDPSKPRWQFHLVDNFEGRSALVLRIHHCYADGIALIQVMLSLTAETAEESLRSRAVEQDRVARDPLMAVFRPLLKTYEKSMEVSTAVMQKSVELWFNPMKAVEYAQQGVGFTSELAKLVVMGEDSKTRFKGKPAAAKRVAWAPPLPLAEVKAIGKWLDCSVNDVLLSCVAGALRTYLVAKGDPVADVVIRALVPVNLRPLEQAKNLGNHFGLVFLPLPVGIEHPFERLYEVRRGMRELKGSYQAMLAFGLLAAVGAGPQMLQEQVLDTLSRNATAVMTNVPGPQKPLYLAGSKIQDLMFWVPQSGDIGMGVSILTYDGRVQFGLVTDKKLVPDPEAIIAGFGPEFEKLVMMSMMSPWTADEAALPVAG
jgi:WS/DGAT/MGAT family acyltransferase